MEEVSKAGAAIPHAKDVIPQETSEMEVDQKLQVASATATENVAAKRERGKGEDDQEKQKVDLDKSVEDVRLEKLEKEEEKFPAPVCLGPKVFVSSMEMFDYFMKLLHSWTANVSVNKYEHMVLSDLLMKGHSDPSSKIGSGIQSFQIRNHPQFKSRCFFLVRVDGSSVDFSFRKCVDRILPLPDNIKPADTITNGGHQKVGGGGRGGHGGRGKRGKF